MARLTAGAPATQMDLAACARPTTLHLWSLAKVQVRLGPSWTMRGEDGVAVMCGGYIFRDRETCEGWFMAAPSARRHMLEIVRFIRLTGIPAPYRRAIVFASTPEGRRIALACGYRAMSHRQDGMEVLEWAV